MSEDQNYPIYQCITIDSASSSDLDDAFSIRKNNEGWTVRCCIADISTIDVGSNLERSARQNVHTVYSGANILKPMIPDESVVSRISLTPRNTLIPVLGVTFKLNPNAEECIDLKVERARLRHLGRYTQKGAATAIKSGQSELSDELRDALTLAIRLMRQRMAALGLDSRNDVYIDESGIFRDLKISDPDTAGYIIVQEIMIATNSLVASWCLNKCIPILFRNHIPKNYDDEAFIAELKIIPAARMHEMGKAFISATCQGHMALQAPSYSWFTSPLRRYVDMVNQHNIMAYLDGHRHFPYPGGEDMRRLAEEIESRLGAINKKVSEGYKLRMQRFVARSLKAGMDFSGVEDGVLIRVIKAASTDGTLDQAPLGLMDECRKRLLTRNTSLSLLSTAIEYGNSDWHHLVFEILARFPEHAVSLLSALAMSSELIASVEFRSTDMTNLTQELVVRTKSGLTVSKIATGSNKALAKQRSAILVLIEIYQVELSESDQEEIGINKILTDPVSKASDNEPGQKEISINACLEDPSNGNYKGKVLEYCVKAKIAPPHVSSTMEQLATSTRHYVTAEFVFLGCVIIAKGEASKLRDAERQAFKEIFLKIKSATLKQNIPA